MCLWSFSEEQGVHIVRVMSGSFMTSLEMAGMSLTLLKVDEEILRLFGVCVFCNDPNTLYNTENY